MEIARRRRRAMRSHANVKICRHGLKYPWAEMSRGSRDTLVDRMKCVICTLVLRKDVTISPKSDTLEKHACKCLAKNDLSLLRVKK